MHKMKTNEGHLSRFHISTWKKKTSEISLYESQFLRRNCQLGYIGAQLQPANIWCIF